MKKLILSGGLVVLFILSSLLSRRDNAVALSQSGSQSQPLPSDTPSMMGSNGNGNGNRNRNMGMMQGAYTDGEYTGNAADAFYGNIQVKAVIKNGKISDVQFLQYPNDRGTSIEINSQAMPILTQEAIQAQNSNVDIVSGATDSSQAFIQSLGSALAQAKK